MSHNSPIQGPSSGSTSEFAKVMSNSRSVSPNNRRSSTTAFESRYTAGATSSSLQPNRRYSNPTTPNTSVYNTSSDSRSRSPSDPQIIAERNNLSNQRRRFSQPVASAGYSYTSTSSASLIRQERESYSSLSYLPEVRTYLRFMEDDTAVPQRRSNSFNGRNSSRRSSFNRRKRSLSRPRTPTPTPANSFHSDYPTVFDQTDPPSQFYGRYLTPQRSMERSANRLSVDYVEPNSTFLYGSREELPPSHYDYSSGSIRTTFI